MPIERYYYDVVFTAGKEQRHVLFSSPFKGYVTGDRIIKRYRSGAVAVIRIWASLGTSIPERFITELQGRSVWPVMLTEA